jgi:hypothetical protein
MKVKKLRYALAFSSLMAILPVSARGQVNPERLAAVGSRLQQAHALYQKMSDRDRQRLSAAARNLFQLAESWEKIRPNLEKPMPFNHSPEAAATSAGASHRRGELVAVSDPATDFLFSLMGGFLQSETDTAWCGKDVVVGFNDSGSLLESMLFGPGGLSGSGVAYSIDEGESFHDIGFVNPGPNVGSFLAGDPVLGCANESTFYYSQLFFTSDSMGNPFNAIALSISTDGGASWADPVPAVSKSGFFHFLDKDWMAVDPTNPKRLFVTYTDIDFEFTTCPTAPRLAIEIARSEDGGETWASPVAVEEVCSIPPNFPFLTGSQVAIGPAGEVYVAWELFPGPTPDLREIDLRKSNNHASSFGPQVKVSNVTEVGTGSAFQGDFRNNEFPMLVVDRSGAKTKGNVYIAWNDGRNLQIPDLLSDNGVYHYADVLLSRSTNGGASWSAPVRVNTNEEPIPGGRGSDQFMPSLAVDNLGKVGACWYDRRLDPSNYAVDRFCGISTDGGKTFTNTRQTLSSWLPSLATDVFVDPFYMGDYDGLTSDMVQGTPGFIGAFQIMSTTDEKAPSTVFVPNPDVFATSFH